MSTNTPRQQAGYERKRTRRNPPVMGLRYARMIAGLTLDQLAERIAEVTGGPAPTRGALSAIESGTRGLSAEMAEAIALAYGLPEDAINTDYEPRPSRMEVAA